MMGARRRTNLEREQLEARLAQILVPVEPNPRFLRRLHARLVTYHGGKPFSGWMIVVIFATATLLAVTAVGLLVRLFLGWLSVLGLIKKGERKPTEPQTISV